MEITYRRIGCYRDCRLHPTRLESMSSMSCISRSAPKTVSPRRKNVRFPAAALCLSNDKCRIANGECRIVCCCPHIYPPARHNTASGKSCCRDTLATVSAAPSPIFASLPTSHFHLSLPSSSSSFNTASSTSIHIHALQPSPSPHPHRSYHVLVLT